ncbi:MAG: HAD-IA family hydrolase [Victivallaceae bacterium]|nr:HAD-IA family hydrolase [Victivallaceae bacterium]
MEKLIVFDLDGTLIDSRLDLAGAVNYMRASMGLEPLQNERIVRMIGNGMSNLVRRAIADTTIDFNESLRRMKLFYADHLLDTTYLYEGVSAGIRELRQSGEKLAVVSNKPTAASKSILDGLGVGEYFDDIIGGDSEYPLKPEPDSILALSAKYGIPAERCWMVGDNYTDLAAGRRAGFRTVLVTYGFGDPKDEKPEFTAESFSEFMMIVRGF